MSKVQDLGIERLSFGVVAPWLSMTGTATGNRRQNSTCSPYSKTMGTIHAATQSTLAYNLKPLSSYALQAQTKEDTESEVIKVRICFLHAADGRV